MPSLKRTTVLHEHEVQVDPYDHHLGCGAKRSLLKKQRRSELAPRVYVATSDRWRQ